MHLLGWTMQGGPCKVALLLQQRLRISCLMALLHAVAVCVCKTLVFTVVVAVLAVVTMVILVRKMAMITVAFAMLVLDNMHLLEEDPDTALD